MSRQTGWVWLDTRSVALCRSLMAIWILWDLYRRFALDGFGWVVSEPSDSVVPIIDPTMTRHKALVHRVWFYRGSVEFQAVVLAVHVLLAVAWGVGWRAGLTGPLLWAAETALHGRNDYICDGSDDTVRHFLFWMALLPGSFSPTPDRGEKVDQVALAKKDDDLVQRADAAKPEQSATTPNQSQTQLQPCAGAHGFSRGSWLAAGSNSNTQVTGPLPFLYILQVVVMYWLMLAMRAKGTTWVYPDFSAVHYAMLCGFVGRTWAKNFVLDFPQLARMATAGGVVLEFGGPLLLLVTSAKHTKLRCLGVAILVFGVQLPLLLMLRLERFQLISAISALCALPSGFWDLVASWRTKQHDTRATGVVRPTPNTSPHQQRPKSRLVNLLQLALSVWIPSLLGLYMVTHAIGDAAGWKEWDNGDIGEATRLVQNWVQFSPNPPDQGYWLTFEGFEFSNSDLAPYNSAETVDAWSNHSLHYKWDTPAGYVHTLQHNTAAASKSGSNAPSRHGEFGSYPDSNPRSNQQLPLAPDPLPELNIPSFLFSGKVSVDLMEAERTGKYRKLSADKAAASRIKLDEDGWMPTYRYPSHYWERYIWAMAHGDDPAQQSYRTHWVSKYFCFRWSLMQEQQILAKQNTTGAIPTPKVKVVSIRVLRYQTRSPFDARITRLTSDDPSWHDPVEEVRMFQTIC